ncbi:MAG: hypothetical protein ACOY0T_33880 [Myxococcota bacterium]
MNFFRFAGARRRVDTRISGIFGVIVVLSAACSSNEGGESPGAGGQVLGFGGAVSAGGSSSAMGGTFVAAGGKFSSSGGASFGGVPSGSGGSGGKAAGGSVSATGGSGGSGGKAAGGSGASATGGSGTSVAGAGGIPSKPPGPGANGLSPYSQECHGNSLDCNDPALRCLGIRDGSAVAGYSCSNVCASASDCSSVSSGTEASAGCVEFVTQKHCLLICQDETGQKACPQGMSCYVYPGTTLGYCLWR